MSSSVLTTSAENRVSEVQNKPRIRLDFLDGLRGFAALYVVLSHVWLLMYFRWDANLSSLQLAHIHLSRAVFRFMDCLQYGHYPVCVFIVLSGYCLMMPIIRSNNRALTGGIRQYFKRRAQRILPPYYAALLFSLILICIVPEMHKVTESAWSVSLPALTPAVVISHLLLIHNLHSGWFFQVNGPMWSVATEWQIYFVFAFLLLPIWRRIGIVAAVIAGFVVGMLPHFLFHHHLDMACPWFIGLFTLGMAGAVISFSPGTVAIDWRERLPWGYITVCTSFVAVMIVRHSIWAVSRVYLGDTAIGLATCCFIVYCTRLVMAGKTTQKSIIVRILQTPWAVRLGTFSYSLYLVHFPILGGIDLLMRGAHAISIVRLGTLLLAGVPLSVLIAYLFHIAFERRFISGLPYKMASPPIFTFSFGFRKLSDVTEEVVNAK